jgi:hypothetical protein
MNATTLRVQEVALANLGLTKAQPALEPNHVPAFEFGRRQGQETRRSHQIVFG